MNSFRGRTGKFPWINVVLFVLTCCSTTIVGTLLMSAFKASQEYDIFSEILRNPAVLISGLPFSISIMTILFAHEMGHYLTCVYYGIDATLPYFIPSPLGTMGAFIKIRSPFQHRGALLDVGVAGPIAGFVLAVPTLIVGLWYSRFVVADPAYGGISFGDPLVFKIFEYVLGRIPPAGMELYLHPIAVAAWFGCLATTMNLLPAGQLDGGHMTYAIFPNLHRRISTGLVIALIPLGIWYWQGWLVWAVLLLILRLRHPITMQDELPLERRHLWLGWIGLAMFILCFMPMPISIT